MREAKKMYACLIEKSCTNVAPKRVKEKRAMILNS